MSILRNRAVAATVAELQTMVRDMVADPAAAGATQRWTNAQINRAIDAQLRELHNTLSGDDASAFKDKFDLSYPAQTQSVELPPEIAATSIYQIEDVDDSSNPFYLDWMDDIDWNRFSTRRGWTFEGRNIAIRPVPSAPKNLRVWYIVPFTPVSTASMPNSDQHPMLINHEELISLGAAVRLQETDDEVSSVRWQRYQALMQKFEQSATKYRGPVHVRTTRSYR